MMTTLTKRGKEVELYTIPEWWDIMGKHFERQGDSPQARAKVEP